MSATGARADARKTTSRMPRRVAAVIPAAPGGIVRWIVLAVGALVFLFPFYYMVIGSLQTEPDTTSGRRLPAIRRTSPSENYVEINERIGLLSGLVNSGIFTGGRDPVHRGVRRARRLRALGAALARSRGRPSRSLLLVQIVPFQLLMIPLYVLIARDYGLADTYFGMILPFAINSAAVLIFRQYFLQVPRALFDAARIDGASELRVLWSVALPLVRPAVLTVVLLDLHRPVERVPLAVPDHQGGVAAAAGRIARQLHHDRVRLGVQPLRGDPGGCRGARDPSRWCCSSSSSATSRAPTSARA